MAERPLTITGDARGRLAAQIRQLRKAAGLGLREAASHLPWDFSHLSHVERADTTPSEALIVQLDVLYAANGLLVSLYEELLGERRRSEYDAVRRERGLSTLLPGASSTSWLPPLDVELPLPGDSSEYLGEVASPIGILLEQGTVFTKSWQIRNTGTTEWRDRFLVRVGPNAAATLVNTERQIPVPLTPPGDTVDLSVRCRAPWIASTSVAHFKMTFADGRYCWPVPQYSHGLDLLVTSVVGPSCTCPACQAIGPIGSRHPGEEIG